MLKEMKEREAEMFYCEECFYKFKKPHAFTQKHGLSAPPFETVYCCPRCLGLSITQRKRGELYAE